MANNQEHKRKILLIEDDSFLVNIYKTKFENEGFEVLVAHDGQKGLEVASTSEYDIMILDLMLPQLSGVDLLRKVRAIDKYKNLPVIVLTNLSKEDETKSLDDLGVKDYLVKADLTPSQLVEKIKTYF